MPTYLVSALTALTVLPLTRSGTSSLVVDDNLIQNVLTTRSAIAITKAGRVQIIGTAVPLQNAIGNQLARCDRTHIACLCPDRV